ncbi:hypothetical protein [Paraburkholderia phytofirmans]|jgi:predicted transcriptional regulator|uniref:hypothetical protein n=1 Tax=Paraburkholderia phytofirmans TaxID=261302 RepID=UPI0038BD359F
MAQEKMLDAVLRQLAETRGTWPEISERSGVPYQTLTKIACRIHADPRVSTVQSLFDYFAGRPEHPSTTESSHAPY